MVGHTPRFCRPKFVGRDINQIPFHPLTTFFRLLCYTTAAEPADITVTDAAHAVASSPLPMANWLCKSGEVRAVELGFNSLGF